MKQAGKQMKHAVMFLLAFVICKGTFAFHAVSEQSSGKVNYVNQAHERIQVVQGTQADEAFSDKDELTPVLKKSFADKVSTAGKRKHKLNFFQRLFLKKSIKKVTKHTGDMEWCCDFMGLWLNLMEDSPGLAILLALVIIICVVVVLVLA